MHKFEAIGRDAPVASAIRMVAFFAVVMLSTLFASGAVYTIDYSVSGYKGSETLENFPVLVRLSTNSPAGFDYNHCAANGADVYFTDASNNVLAHEIDTWDTSGESLIWVKIPSVTPVAQRSMATFTMHYRLGDSCDHHASRRLVRLDRRRLQRRLALWPCGGDRLGLRYRRFQHERQSLLYRRRYRKRVISRPSRRQPLDI